MADGTHIEWTDATWNVVNGCSVLSPGCTNCYAMRLAGTRLKHHPSREGLTTDTKAGPVWNGIVRFNEVVLRDPLKWGRARRIFVCAHGDLFHEAVPDEWLDRVFAVMALCPQHQFQVLTKRPERMRDYVHSLVTGNRSIWMEARDLGLNAAGIAKAMNMLEWGSYEWKGAKPLPNVWLGVSVEDQKRADERIPVLLDTPAAVRWLSCEPLLGPVDLAGIMAIATPTGHTDQERWGIHPLKGRYGIVMYGCGGDPDWLDGNGNPCPRIDWVVAGGESGPGARPMQLAWVRDLVAQCKAAGVAVLVKQLGRYPETNIDEQRGWVMRDPKGGNMDEWPEDLRVREYPGAA